MSDTKSGGSVVRNPKSKPFTVRVTPDISARVERLADAAGIGKSVMAAILLAAGLRQLEAMFLLQMPTQVDAIVEEQSQGLVSDISSVAPPGFIK